MFVLTRIAAMSFLIGLYVGCSPVKFNLDNSKCKEDGCIVVDGQFAFNYSATAGHGKVDILIVNDNSASMSFEQARLAPRFANFISDLDSRNIDYRIAMTTTDVAGSGSLKGGNLISFNGNPYLTPKMSDRVALFNKEIQRSETLACEKFIADWIRSHGGSASAVNQSGYAAAYSQNCPSGDERGIYAANLVVKNNPSSFIRSDAHFSVIVLSDEDERSGLYKNSSSGFPLEDYDQPGTLVENVKKTFGVDKYNSMSVHAIVVKDQTCLNNQNTQTLDGYSPTTGLVAGSLGSVYLTFIDSGWGNSADICSNDYTTQLGQIRAKITEKIKDIVLKCNRPNDLRVTVNGISAGYTVDGKTLKLDSALSEGTTVNLSYKCATLD